MSLSALCLYGCLLVSHLFNFHKFDMLLLVDGGVCVSQLTQLRSSFEERIQRMVPTQVKQVCNSDSGFLFVEMGTLKFYDRLIVNRHFKRLHIYLDILVIFCTRFLCGAWSLVFSNFFIMTQCRVLSLSDRRYSLNPLSQTRIDWVGRYRIRLTFKLSCVWH